MWIYTQTFVNILILQDLNGKISNDQYQNIPL